MKNLDGDVQDTFNTLFDKRHPGKGLIINTYLAIKKFWLLKSLTTVFFSLITYYTVLITDKFIEMSSDGPINKIQAMNEGYHKNLFATYQGDDSNVYKLMTQKHYNYESENNTIDEIEQNKINESVEEAGQEIGRMAFYPFLEIYVGSKNNEQVANSNFENKTFLNSNSKGNEKYTQRPPLQKLPFSAMRRPKQRPRRENLFSSNKYNSISPIRDDDVTSNFLESEKPVSNKNPNVNVGRVWSAAKQNVKETSNNHSVDNR